MAAWLEELKEITGGVTDVIEKGLDVRDRIFNPTAAPTKAAATPPITETKGLQVEATTAPAGVSAHPLLIAGGLLLLVLLASEIK